MLERWDFEGSIDVRETFYSEADDEADADQIVRAA